MVKRISIVLMLISMLIMSCVIVDAPLFESFFPNPTVEVPQIQVTEVVKTEEAMPVKEISATQTLEPEVSKNIPSAENELYPYEAQPGTPTLTTAWLYGCDWFGIGGQVLDQGGTPVEYFVIEAGGSVNDQEIIGLSIVGTASDYGPGGYEIKISNQPVDTMESIWIQMKNIEGINLSGKIFINTSEECSQNLILLNFVKSGETEKNRSYLPIIIR